MKVNSNSCEYNTFQLPAVFATAAMHFAVILNRETIQDWYSAGQLESIKLFAFICFDISTAAFIWYIFYAVYYSIRKYNTSTSCELCC